MNQYDPVEYWNKREHPNTLADPGVSAAQASCVSKFLGNAESILEIGPGVGRLFPLYAKLKNVNTVDISRNYSERLRRVAQALGIPFYENFLDSPTDTFPFSDRAFDCGIASFVFLHIPFETIPHTMAEMARVCKRVLILTGVSEEWPKSPSERKPTSHCFNHDYLALCEEVGCEVKNRGSVGTSIWIEYGSKT